MAVRRFIRPLVAAITLAVPASAFAQVKGNTAAATSLTVSTLTTGTTLGVNLGSVSSDHRYVGVSVDPQSSILNGIDTFSAGSNGPFRPAQIGKVVLIDHDKPLLAASVPALSLKQTSLKAAVRAVAGATKGNLVLGLRGLDEAKVDYNAPHDFILPPGSVKDDLLALLKIGAPETDMVITAEDQVIQVSTQAQADNAIVTRTYYLEDLLHNVSRYVPGDTDLNTVGPKQKTAPASPDGEAPAPTPPKKPASVSTNIAELITSTVRPEIWKVNGGKYGEIMVVGDHVTVKAPLSVQELLDGPKVYNPNQVPMYVQYGQ